MTVVDIIIGKLAGKFAPYQRMANVIIAHIRKNGDCVPDDLLTLGFTKQETIELWHMAEAMANVELKLMENKRSPNLKWREVRHA